MTCRDSVMAVAWAGLAAIGFMLASLRILRAGTTRRRETTRVHRGRRRGEKAMTREELDAIRARVDAATPGPWEWKWPELLQVATVGPHRYTAGRVLREDDDAIECASGENSEFIVHAREDIPRLLAEVERLTETRQRTIDEIVRWLHARHAEGAMLHPSPGALADRLARGEPWDPPESGSGSSIRA